MLKRMISLFRIIAVSTVLALLAGCAPRGETRTLDQVLESARGRFEKADRSSVAPEAGTQLSRIEGHLKRLADGEGAAEELNAVADELGSLIPMAGFTNRPALTELGNQYRQLSSSSNRSSGAIRLLVARTYRALASEIETTKFRVAG
ncbi:MAG: hypothetical protein D6719_05530 [Candidatus Dadabacteria bacterium]|nr:MAG: hypothetical protein D6719_05530 [Candidatus Dadabacteria bacterium]